MLENHKARTKPLIPHSKLQVQFGLLNLRQQNPVSYFHLCFLAKSKQFSAEIFFFDLAFSSFFSSIWSFHNPPTTENECLHFETRKGHTAWGGSSWEWGRTASDVSSCHRPERRKYRKNWFCFLEFLVVSDSSWEKAFRGLSLAFGSPNRYIFPGRFTACRSSWVPTLFEGQHDKERGRKEREGTPPPQVTCLVRGCCEPGTCSVLRVSSSTARESCLRG